MVNERLKLVAADIIDPAQVGFMQGRFIGEYITGTLDLIQYAHIYDIPAILIAVDFHKAFDVIKRNSLYYLLHNMNIGKSFIHYNKLVYTDIRCTVVNSGWSGNYFNPTRGLFQGICSAPLLYNIVSQALLRKILNDSSIEGVLVCNTFTDETRTQTAKFYADDSLLSVKRNEKNVQAVFQILDKFYIFVGLSINCDKNTIVRIGSLCHSKAIFYMQKKLAWSDGVFTLLGVQINIHDLHDISCYQTVAKKMYTVLDSRVHQHCNIITP